MFLDEKYEGNSVSCIVVREAKLPNQAVLSDIAFIVVQKKSGEWRAQRNIF